MKKLVVPFIIVMLVAAMFPVGAEARMGTRLIAGQSAPTDRVGWVFIDNDADNLLVTYETWYGMGFCLVETHLHVADTWQEIPQTPGGNPIPGQFDYSGDHPCVRMVTYTIPLGDWGPGDEVAIAAHAVVESWRDPNYEETGWGVVCGDTDNYPFPGSQWANWIPYTIK